MQVEIYHGHAGLFHQMANHIELSMMPQHRRENGGPDPITTNDITLAATLFNAIYGYPAGKEAVFALSAGLIPGEERSQSVLGVRPDSHVPDHSTPRPGDGNRKTSESSRSI